MAGGLYPFCRDRKTRRSSGVNQKYESLEKSWVVTVLISQSGPALARRFRGEYSSLAIKNQLPTTFVSGVVMPGTQWHHVPKVSWPT